MTYTLKGFGPLISLLPYQFGFVPTDSYVVAFLDGNTLEACVRFDADDAAGYGEVLADLCAEICAKRNISGAIVVAYGITGTIHDRVVAQQIRDVGIAVHHRLVVRGERWRVRTCEPGCCDMTWHELDSPSDVGPIAEMVMRGIAPLSCRSEALAVLNRRDALARRSLSRAIVALDEDGTEGTNRGTDCAWCAYLAAPIAKQSLLARTVAALCDIEGRDKAIWSLVPELAGPSPLAPVHSRESAADHEGHVCRVDDLDLCLQRLLEALPAIPDDARATWLCFIALIRWRSGDQSGASMAACCAIDEAPSSGLAQICSRMLETRSAYEDFCTTRNATSSNL